MTSTKLNSLHTSLELLNDDLETEKGCLEDLKEDLPREVNIDDYIQEYESMLDETNGDFMGMSASYILKECDSTAYRCGLNDYCGNDDITETEEYLDVQCNIEDQQEAIECLEEKIMELEEEIEELELKEVC